MTDEDSGETATGDTGDTGDTGTGDSGESDTNDGHSGETDSGDTDSGDSGDTGSTPCDVAADGSAPYLTVQDAVDAATDGDTLLVCPGMYAGFIVDRRSAAVTVQGVDAATTIIDGGNDPAVRVEEGSITLQELTLTATPDDWIGALNVLSGTVTASGLVITGVRPGSDASAAAGVGVFMQDSDVAIDGLLASDNLLNEGTLIATDGGTLLLRHGLFTENEGALLGIGATAADISNNLFFHNTSFNAVPFYLVGSGGAVRVYNNTITEQVIHATNYPPYVVLLARSEVNLTNNILARNDGYVDADAGDFDYNDIYQNGDRNCVGACDGAGVLTEDPRFVDPAAGDFSLDVAFSPCVDAGNPLAGYDDVDGSVNDMGAFGGPNGSW